jgi:hypothetical protein
VVVRRNKKKGERNGKKDRMKRAGSELSECGESGESGTRE